MLSRSRGGNIYCMKSDDKQIAEYVVNNIDVAIEKGWVKVFYQPVIRTLTGQLCGAESLARWIDPEYGFLAPNKFIGPLEESGQIHKLDCFIVDKVCSDIAERLGNNLDTVAVSVNFSKLDFETADMLEVVKNAVAKYNIPRDYIHIEITESMIVSNADLMRGVIDGFRNAGFEVWMDDFGSGYSSLNHLKDYEFDTIKMDMEFLASFTDKSKAIMTSAISMAKDIGLMTLAEGVETQEQVDFLYSIGCGKLQGYFYGKPLPLDEFFEHIKEKGITIEPRRWRHYYQAGSFCARYTDEPLEIIEDDGKDFRTLFMNKAYKRQIFTRDYTIEELDHVIYKTKSPLLKKYREYADTIEKTKNLETFYYTFDGNIICFQGVEISEMEGKHLIKGSVRNISLDNDFKKQNNVGNKLRELNHLFESIMIINIEKDTIFPLIGRSKYIEIPETTNNVLQEHLNRLVEGFIADVDRDKFFEFTNTSTLKSRIEASDNGYISNLFRFKGPDGNYKWKEMSIMMVPGSAGKEYLVCGKATADDAAHFFEKDNKIHNLEDYGIKSDDVFSLKMWESIVAGSSVKFFWKDKDCRFLGASRAFLDFFDVKIEDILGKTTKEMGWLVDEKAYDDAIQEVLSKGNNVLKLPGQCIINGIVHNVMSDKRPIYENGQIIGLMGHVIDVDEELSRLDKTYNERRLDPVTGLMNVSALADVTRSYAHNYAVNNVNYALLILRNEYHHRIVEDYGEEFGNKLLKRAGEVILEVTDGKCAVAKCLGADFAMITDVTEVGELKALVDKLRTELESIKKLDGYDLTLKIHIAYKLRNEEGITDENMYSAVLDVLMK